MRRLALAISLGLGLMAASAQAQTTPIRLEDGDVARFWTAYDAVRAADTPEAQKAAFQRLYIDAGTPGLAAFMEAKG